MATIHELIKVKTKASLKPKLLTRLCGLAAVFLSTVTMFKSYLCFSFIKGH